MMRTGTFALLLLLAACGGSGGGNQAGDSGNAAAPSAAVGEQRDAAATVTLAAAGPGGCSARWDGQPATPQQVLDRSSALVGQAIETAGGVSNLTEETIPTVAVVAPANLGFGCADTFLSAIRRAGVPSVLLKPEGGAEAALADFTLSDIGAPPPSVVLALGAGGRLTWNNEAISVDDIAERMRQRGAAATDIEAPPGELELRPAREASFGRVHEVLSAVRAGHMRAALLLPSVQPSRPPAPIPAPPAPADNQAAASNVTTR
jgi:biopolymer transport protein ExbD